MEDVRIKLSTLSALLIVAGLVFNLLTIWYAWGWRKPAHSEVLA